MEGITFYREPNGMNVFAAFTANGTHRSGNGERMQEGLGAVYDRRNSPVAGTSASMGYLATCEVITEEEARKIHPELFVRLDNDPK